MPKQSKTKQLATLSHFSEILLSITQTPDGVFYGGFSNAMFHRHRSR